MLATFAGEIVAAEDELTSESTLLKRDKGSCGFLGASEQRAGLVKSEQLSAQSTEEDRRKLLESEHDRELLQQKCLNAQQRLRSLGAEAATLREGNDTMQQLLREAEQERDIYRAKCAEMTQRMSEAEEEKLNLQRLLAAAEQRQREQEQERTLLRAQLQEARSRLEEAAKDQELQREQMREAEERLEVIESARIQDRRQLRRVESRLRDFGDDSISAARGSSVNRMSPRVSPKPSASGSPERGAGSRQTTDRGAPPPPASPRGLTSSGLGVPSTGGTFDSGSIAPWASQREAHWKERWPTVKRSLNETLSMFADGGILAPSAVSPLASPAAVATSVLPADAAGGASAVEDDCLLPAKQHRDPAPILETPPTHALCAPCLGDGLDEDQ